MKREEKVHSMLNIFYLGDMKRNILFNPKICYEIRHKIITFFNLKFRGFLSFRNKIFLYVDSLLLLLKDISQAC